MTTGQAWIVHLRGVAQPLELYTASNGAADLLTAFDAWRAGA